MKHPMKDRVEIRNPGTLYGSISIQDLRTGNISQRRNPLVAEILRRIEMVEGWGRGMPLILKNEPNVQFREAGQLFIVSFHRPSFEEEENGEVTKQTTDNPHETAEKGPIKGPKKTTRDRVLTRGDDSTKKSVESILSVLETNGELSSAEIIAATHRKTKTGNLKRQMQL